jgi:hybrid cluster-associated redox disulfide protein
MSLGLVTRSRSKFVRGQRIFDKSASASTHEEGFRMSVHFDDLVDDVMSRSPQAIRVFLRFKMRCVGCPIACFHTVDDACREHGVDREAFLAALRA